MGAMARHGISGATTPNLDRSITEAMARLDERGRRRREQRAAASSQRVITDDMPVGLQVHLAKMGARDERTDYTTGNPLRFRGEVTETTKDEEPADGEGEDTDDADGGDDAPDE